MRMEYLFALGNICHQPASAPLKIRDFFGLVLAIDAYIEAQRKANSG